MKQRALLTKYPDPAQFILDYNPDLQFKIVRCNATHADLALNLEIPSLGLLASTYGDETPLEWLKIQFGTLNDFAEVSTKIAKTQLEELAAIFLSEYYYINAAEICFFIARFKSGQYGRFYGAIDPMKITSAMLEYTSERRRGIERHDAKRNFNTAIAAIRKLKQDVDKTQFSTQENFGNDSDCLLAFIRLLVDRCGDDDKKMFAFYNYIKRHPSQLGLDLSDEKSTFAHIFESNEKLD